MRGYLIATCSALAGRSRWRTIEGRSGTSNVDADGPDLYHRGRPSRRVPAIFLPGRFDALSGRVTVRTGYADADPFVDGQKLAEVIVNNEPVTCRAEIRHIDPDGTVRTIEASPGPGVHIGTLNWHRVASIKRPELPNP